MITPTATGHVSINLLGRYNANIADEGGAEIVVHDPATDQLFVVNAFDVTIDVLDLSDPTMPTLVTQIPISPTYGGGVNSVDVYGGVMAAAVQNLDKQAPGTAVFFTTNGTYINHVDVGALPDMLTFTPDGQQVLVANEGEPNGDYTIDPEGSVSVIDLSNGVENATVQTADFTAWNGRAAELRAKGVRIYPTTTITSSVAQDIEPEYISVSPDGSTAIAILQENNAFGVIDLATATVVDIIPLGVKDHSKGYARVENYPFTELPDLGMTEAGQTIQLGGLSGLWFEGTDESTGHYKFATVPDRGPNGDSSDVDNDGMNERPFALPDYQARVVRFELNPTTGTIVFTDETYLTRPDGITPITGLPNIPGVDEEPVDLFGADLPYDEMGADMEGIIIGPNGDFWMVDEYRPAIYHFAADGTMVNRYVPQGTASLATPPQPAGTYGSETLPADYANRRANRGFEAMALDTDTDILYAFIQTPLANPDRATSDNSDVIRVLGIDLANGAPVAEYVYLLEGSDHRSNKVDKIGDAVYAGGGKFYVIERDSSRTANGKKFIFEMDLLGATNLLAGDAPALPMDKTLEQHTADELAALGIQPVHKRKVLNLPSIGYLAGDKPEGLAMLPNGRLAVLNDNDFGLLDEEIPVDGTITLDPNPTPITLGIIHFGEGNMLDASNEDGPIVEMEATGRINIQNWPVLGSYMPDAIASYTAHNGYTYYITANEGDSRDYDGFSEEDRMGNLTLDPERFPDAATLQENAHLGRLKTSNQFGDLDRDGDYDQLHSYGTRSFSIWDEYGNLVYDSSDDFALITADRVPERFNANGSASSFDSRSDDKGAEPEAVVIGHINGRDYAFVGLERVGGIMIYDVTHPTHPVYVDYFPAPEEDISPEGLAFVSAEDSPTNSPLLILAHEISGTTAVYELQGTYFQNLPIIHK
ncbi:MAG: esterase-like activity of phytase family protein [Chloroflexota bacterium]